MSERDIKRVIDLCKKINRLDYNIDMTLDSLVIPVLSILGYNKLPIINKGNGMVDISLEVLGVKCILVGVVSYKEGITSEHINRLKRVSNSLGYKGYCVTNGDEYKFYGNSIDIKNIKRTKGGIFKLTSGGYMGIMVYSKENIIKQLRLVVLEEDIRKKIIRLLDGNIDTGFIKYIRDELGVGGDVADRDIEVVLVKVLSDYGKYIERVNIENKYYSLSGDSIRYIVPEPKRLRLYGIVKRVCGYNDVLYELLVYLYNKGSLQIGIDKFVGILELNKYGKNRIPGTDINVIRQSKDRVIESISMVMRLYDISSKDIDVC